MNLSGKIYIGGLLKATKAQLFKDIQVGDVLELTIALKDPGRGRELYATQITIKNLRNNHIGYESLTTLMSRLKNFEWEEYKPEQQ